MNRDAFRGKTGAEYIRAMFVNTGADGDLTLEKEGEASVTWYMDWDEAAAEEIAVRFAALVAALTQLGKEHGYWERSTRDMPEDLLEVWNTYVAPLPENDFDEDALEELWMKSSVGEELTEEEKELDRQYLQWFEEIALQRLPYNRCSSLFLMNRARRFEKLISLHAPAAVVNMEELAMAEEFALYHGLLEFG